MSEGKNNTGDCNSGNSNSGNSNSGNCNSGNCNSGNSNSGNCNSGNSNSGNRNSGYWNSGNCNSGNSNSGNCNSGYWNSGNWNSGNWNSGNWNSGNWNSGDWNSGDWNSGYFNTETPKTVLAFNKECDREEWENADKPRLLYFYLTKFVGSEDMTQEEKNANVTHETCGGYLKVYDYKEAFQKSYNEASEEDKALLLKLPNFDADVFFEISGIDVRKAKEKCAVKQYDEFIEINGVKYKRCD